MNKWGLGLVILALGAAACDSGLGAANNNNNHTAPAVCGNGVTESGEECDEGSANSDSDPDACRSDCRLYFCGDNTIDTNEFCDDGNNTGGDGCSADCSTTEVCGNGLVDSGEECDDGNVDGGDGCGPSCTVEGCGNGAIDAGETCDDGDFLSHDGCSSTCQAEDNLWTELAPGTVPPSRRDQAMAYDSDRGVLVMFGGRNVGAGAHSDTWEFDGQSWSQAAPVASPPDLVAINMAYDANRQVMVLFGGRCWSCPGAPALQGRHWEYDATTWTEVITLPSDPPPRASQSMIYDPVGARVIMYGGCGLFNAVGNCTLFLDDTWAHDGAGWQQLQPTFSPPGRAGAAIAYDSAHQSIMLFGGSIAGGLANDLWEFDGVEWQNVAQTNPPPARGNHGMVFDERRGGLIIFGGYDGAGFSDTWEFDGTAWQEQTLNQWPANRWSFGLVYFPPARGGILFGGWNVDWLDDTWLLRFDTVPPEPDELCDTGTDEDGDGLISCADPDCEGLSCGTGLRCSAGACQ